MLHLYAIMSAMRECHCNVQAVNECKPSLRKQLSSSVSVNPSRLIFFIVCSVAVRLGNSVHLAVYLYKNRRPCNDNILHLNGVSLTDNFCKLFSVHFPSTFRHFHYCGTSLQKLNIGVIVIPHTTHENASDRQKVHHY